jgi:mono/diheme cytochrome c family protein
MRPTPLLLGLLLLAGCDDMSHQPKENAYASARTAPGKVPSGTVEFQEIPAPVPKVTMALLLRGRERFHIYCTPCHSELGDGNGMIVQRGFPAPPSYHIDRLRFAPLQHFFDVITHGHGAMYSYAQRIPPEDRWAIVAYIRALQRSQNVPADQLTPEQRAALP